MFFVTLQKKSGRKSRQGEVRRDRTVLLAVGALPAAREKCVFLDFIFTTNNLKQNVTTHFYRNMFCNVFVCLCISFFFRLRCQLGQNEVQNKYKRRKIYVQQLYIIFFGLKYFTFFAFLKKGRKILAFMAKFWFPVVLGTALIE